MLLVEQIPIQVVSCATCDGQGSTRSHNLCKPCSGVGKIKVAKPATRCPRCKGTGEAPKHGDLAYLEFCAVCRGTGWSLTFGPF